MTWPQTSAGSSFHFTPYLVIRNTMWQNCSIRVLILIHPVFLLDVALLLKGIWDTPMQIGASTPHYKNVLLHFYNGKHYILHPRFHWFVSLLSLRNFAFWYFCNDVFKQGKSLYLSLTDCDDMTWQMKSWTILLHHQGSLMFTHIFIRGNPNERGCPLNFQCSLMQH